MDNTSKRNPLSFFKWTAILMVFFTLVISLWTVVLNQDILSKLEHLKIPLSSYYGVYHINGKINNSSISFILDSGASETVISESVLSRITKYSKNDNIKYLDGAYYNLADGSNVFCKRIRVSEMQIGDYSINNIIIAIMPKDTENLLGKNVLDKFKSWHIDKNKKELTLVK
jgi:clan AA aspartic protease (TIGR02281 family)